METLTDNKLYEMHDVRRLDDFRAPIMHALTEINRRSGNHYSAEVIYHHLCSRVLSRGNRTAVIVILDQIQKTMGTPLPDCVSALMTWDMFEDEIGMPLACISRAWCKPGLFYELWPIAKPAFCSWAAFHNSRDVCMQSERDSAWARVLKADGFELKESTLRANLDELRRIKQ
jgi:hypothetical protein